MRKILIISICVCLASCGQKNAENIAQVQESNQTQITLTKAQLKNANLSFAKPQQKEMATVLKLNGKIDVPPQNMVSISVPMGGYLKTTKLLPGMHVNKGEVIAIIEDQQYIQLQQDYLLAKAKIVYAKLEYERQLALNQSKASSDKVFQQATAEYNSLKIMLSSLAEKLKLIGKNPATLTESNISRSINVYAPINGFVSKVNVNVGKYISPTDVLFELVNPADIHLALTVFEKDLVQLYVGQRVIAYTNNEPSKKHYAEVLLIGKDLSNERSTEVHCHFEDYDKSLIPGTYMNAEVLVKTGNNLVLPEEAVVNYENKQYAFIQKSANSFEMVQLQTGVVKDGYIALLNAQALANSNFVAKGAYTLLMSLKNKPEED
jgi:cobalt-zinc-cadmium efflux system membrane fusion protein